MTIVRWAVTALVVAATLAWDPAGWYLGLLGALAGVLLVLNTAQAGLALGAVLFGLRVTHVRIGIGSELKSWTSSNRRILLRSMPVLAAVGIAGRKAGVRRRTVAAGALAIFLAAVVTALAWLAIGSAFGKGLALAATACLLLQLVPIDKPGHTSFGWYLFGLTRLSGRPLAEFEATPKVMDGMDAYYRGDLDTAERFADELAAEHPELLTGMGVRVAAMCARERYLEALQLVIGLSGRQDLEPREMAFVMATTAGIAVQAVEAGQFPAEVGLETAKNMLGNAYELGYPRYRANGTLAMIALVEGDTAEAKRLADLATDYSEEAVGLADDLVTKARAFMQEGDNAKARELVTEAHELAGWYPRVAATRARLEVS